MPVINISYASRERPQFDPQALAVAGQKPLNIAINNFLYRRIADEREAVAT